ncbi:hypothetical protein ACQPX6_19645 [Actinomycetospora sp. CA-101289]|uniref:hypothetical protein n=1 Tax=Actinomycetospora sp. CA-101289 TaxID=3239893 RepID=UPI003D991575
MTGVLVAVLGVALVAVAELARHDVLVYATGRDRPVGELPGGMPYAAGPGRTATASLVYLDGIGKMRFRDTRDGGRLVARIVADAPELRVLGHVLPYSPLARPLAERRTAPWLRRHAALVLFLYNVAQILVAADARYRPLYNRAVGAEISEQLRRAGHPGDGRTPVVLLGYSGGAQIATGAVHEVATRLGAPVTVIGLGGFHSGANDLAAATAFHELTSGHDAVERVGRWLFPLRWPVPGWGPWNRARRAGKVHVHRLDPAHHVGPSSYISPTALLPDGRSHLQRTADVIVRIVRTGS